MRVTEGQDFDVIILGSGIAGTVLGTVLASQGISTLIIDASTHPRFAVGESTIPQTSQILSLISRKYGVPELGDIGMRSPPGLRKHVGDTCGIKRHFGYAYHRPGAEHDPREAHVFGNIWRPENHFFRQDVDAYLLHLAISKGVHVLQNTMMQDVTFQPDGVTVQTKTGSYRAKYLVDGSGFRSPLAEKFDLREAPPRFNHHSRSLFTHMLDVEPFEESATSYMSVPWSAGTLHHIFERGWIWVIPFNNYEGSTNPLVSVGLTVDPRYHPEVDVSPEKEFADFISQFPAVERQFAKAKAVRPWVRTGRLQYSSKKTVGERYCLLSHAEAFIDPLFSRGMLNSLELVETLADALIQAAKEDDYGTERFEHIEKQQRAALYYTDRIVHGSFVSWSDFDLWDAWMRIWAIGIGVTESNFGSHLIMGQRSKWTPMPNALSGPFEGKGFRALFEQSYEIILKFDRSEMSGGEASRAIFALLQAHEFEMQLPDRMTGHEWAIVNPGCRDLYLGDSILHARWKDHEPDPPLVNIDKVADATAA